MNSEKPVKRSVSARSARKPSICIVVVIVICMQAGSCNKPVSGPGQVQLGVASWYGKPFNGRRTASGEIYDMEKLTAAHPTLPFGTIVSVLDSDTNRVTQVRINDRGPFVPGRIIDLSHAAAQGIDMPGTAKVRLHVISIPATRAADLFAVQIGSFAEHLPAQNLRDEMEHDYGAATLIFRPGDQTWRVLVGLEPTLQQAQALAQELGDKYGPAFVVRVDEG